MAPPESIKESQAHDKLHYLSLEDWDHIIHPCDYYSTCNACPFQQNPTMPPFETCSFN